MSELEKIAIFGYRDSMVGQLIESMRISANYNIMYFISVNELPNLDISNEHKKRPNNKTEFVVNNKIYGKQLWVGKNYVDKLKNDGIKKVAILEDDRELRSQIFSSIKETKIEILSFIHPSVFLGGFNTFGEGVVIFPNCYIGYKSDIGKGTVIQSNSVVEHHNKIGSFVNINPGLTTGGFTSVGDFVAVSMSVDILNRINIETRAQIGAGSLVMKDCKANTLYYGRPAKAIREI